MKTMCEILLTFIGRACLGLIFVLAAVNKIQNAEGTEKMMKSVMAGPDAFVQVPEGAIPALRWAAIVCELGGAVLLIVGFAARLGSLILILALIPATLYFHRFWGGAQLDNSQMTNFLKNVAIFGGLLLVLARGPGMCSFDYWRAAKKKMPE